MPQTITTALQWTPEPGNYPAPDIQALILSQEHLTDISASLTVTAADPQSQVPHALRWTTPAGAPDLLHVNVEAISGGMMLTLDILDWVGVFPISIDVMSDGGDGAGVNQTPQQFERWQDVPAPAADVYAYRASPDNVRHFALAVEALDTTGRVIEKAEYTITVYANYTAGKTALQAAVQARSVATSTT